MATANVQLGKQGITENFISSLQNYFKTRQSVRISVLKSAREEGKEGKAQVKEYSEKILEKLGKNYTSKVIGFVITLKKWRREMRE